MFPRQATVPRDHTLVRGQSPNRSGVKRVTDALTALPRLITKGHGADGTVNEIAPVSPDLPRELDRATTADGSRALDSSAIRQRTLTATVRLRVDDARGNSYGTGTVIDVHGDEALVLTCAHIFRASGGQGRIVADTFHASGNQPILGKLISHDMNRDVALVSIRPPIAIQPVAVAGAGQRLEPGQSVFSIGCDRGGSPEIIEGRIVAINRYLGPPNLVVTGRPVDGRSGGGLFAGDGTLIGVCNAADPEANEGVYAALGAVHQQLDAAGLGFIHREPSVPKKEQLADSAHVAPQPTVAPRNPEARLASQLRRLPAIDDDSEVIFIVRQRSGADSRSQVYVLDHPSADFVGNLVREIEQNRIAKAGTRTGPTIRAQDR
jgi:S1-C subfamily serine protease